MRFPSARRRASTCSHFGFRGLTLGLMAAVLLVGDRARPETVASLRAAEPSEPSEGEPAALRAKLQTETAELSKAWPDADDEEKSEIIARWMQIGPEAVAAAPLLLEALRDPGLALEASDALSAMLGEGVPALRQGLRHEDPNVQLLSLVALPWMRRDAEPLIPDVVHCVETGIPQVRMSAIETLGKLRLRPETAVPPLIGVLQEAQAAPERFAGKADEQAQVATAAVMAEAAIESLLHYASVGAAEAKEALGVLEEMAGGPVNEKLRQQARSAVLNLDEDGRRAARVMAAALPLPDVALAGFVFSPQGQACSGLAALGERARPVAPQVTPLLIEILSSEKARADGARYEAAAHALTAFDARQIIPLLRADLQRELPRREELAETQGEPFRLLRARLQVHAAAAAALLRFDPTDEAALTALLELLKHDREPHRDQPQTRLSPVRGWREVALDALGRLGERGRPALELLKSQTSYPRGQAAWAVAQIDPHDRACEQWELGEMAPFGRASPRRVAKVLGDRLPALTPAAIEAAFVLPNARRQRHVELLELSGPEAVAALVDRAFRLRPPGPEDDGPRVVDEADETEPEDLSWEAYLVLDDLGARAKPAFETLVRRTKSPNHYVRATAAEMLGRVAARPEESMAALRPLLADERIAVRARAIAALGNLGAAARAVEPELQTLTQDPSPWLQTTARTAIQQLSAR